MLREVDHKARPHKVLLAFPATRIQTPGYNPRLAAWTLQEQHSVSVDPLALHLHTRSRTGGLQESLGTRPSCRTPGFQSFLTYRPHRESNQRGRLRGHVVARGEKRRAILAGRRRRLVELPRHLEAAEKRAFEAAKRWEAKGKADRAAAIFEASRIAFQARTKLLAMETMTPGLDDALEAAENILKDLQQRTP